MSHRLKQHLARSVYDIKEMSLATRPTVTFKVARVAAAWQSCTDAARVTQRVEKSACLCVDWA